MRRSFGQITPTGVGRKTRSRASAARRAADTSTGTPSGSTASSATRANGSSTTRPALTSGIDTLLERLDANPTEGVEENFVGPRAQFEVGGGDVLDHVGDLVKR